jgi:glycine/D-amino acid oxidase-like deaminating enzyme
VLGLEQHSDSGSIGTASYGTTRIWRLSHDDYRYTAMQMEALEIWKEIEEKSGKQLLVKTGMLYVDLPTSENFHKVVAQKGGHMMNA